jgi:ATP-binding cassette, subfamily C, bacterial PrsD
MSAIAPTATVIWRLVYDRVIPSKSLPTLDALLLLAPGLYAVSGFLDVLRARVLGYIAAMIDTSLTRNAEINSK